MTDILWRGDSMTYAKEHVSRGILVVDADGRVWRNRAWSHDHWKEVPRRRAESPAAKGYLRVAIGITGGGTTGVKAHRLVYEVLVGPIPNGLEINHKNLNKTDNRPDNLEPITGAGNVQHSYANGRTRPWSRATTWRPGREKLTAEQIAIVREMRGDGRVLREIAAHMGISITHAHRLTEDIKCRKE